MRNKIQTNMNHNILTESNIDNRNRKLWEDLISAFPNISIEENIEPNYAINIKENTIKIFVDKNCQSPASFTHELLHIELKLLNKIEIGRDLSRLISKDKILNYIFSKDLEDHITNVLEHVKFIDKFKFLGFSEVDFLSDFESIKISDVEIEYIKTYYKREEIFDKDCIDFYIGKFFGIKACTNKKFNYTRYLNELKSIDSTLYQTLDRFWNHWIEYDIQNSDKKFMIFIKKPRYQKFLKSFIKELNIWAKSKTIL
jgi:hypothetical protein